MGKQINNSKLIAGCIPANTECPFKSKCKYSGIDITNPVSCMHKGNDHSVEYSCGTAREFDLMEKNNK